MVTVVCLKHIDYFVTKICRKIISNIHSIKDNRFPFIRFLLLVAHSKSVVGSHATPTMAIHIKKESVELTFVYLSEGCGMT